MQRRFRLLNNGKFNSEHPSFVCRCWTYPHNDASTSSLLQYEHQLTERKMMSKLGRKYIRPTRFPQDCNGNIISLFQQCPCTDLHCNNYCKTLNLGRQLFRPIRPTPRLSWHNRNTYFCCLSNTLARICIATFTASSLLRYDHQLTEGKMMSKLGKSLRPTGSPKTVMST